MNVINLNSPDLMDAKTAAAIWGKADNFVRIAHQRNPKKFPDGTIRKFGKMWLVTTSGMEAATGMKDPRRQKAASNGGDACK